ncbi:MAG: DUF4126 domain-containing protein [Gemmatimonadota bacterium]
MDTLVTLGRTLGFSFTAGINLYATVAVLGLVERFDWVALPPQFAVFDNNWVIGAALALYVIEFVADKIPFVDTIWDGAHTVIRPLGGALIAIATLGPADPTVQALVALLGGAVAGTTHVAKAGSRAMVNTSPEPFSNTIVSVMEDGFVFALAAISLLVPLVALGIVAALLVVIAVFATVLIRAWRRRRAARRARAMPLPIDPPPRRLA